MKINKIVDEYKGTIYFNDTVVGRFDNVMECLDFRYQIAQNKVSGYYYIIDNYPNKIIIDELGGVENHPDLINTPSKYSRELYNLQQNDRL
ncbi:hypothetical protein MEO93_20920 [Dolichospermum sp. ST_sed3]|nr:hypothetical protein [Dolichospermum sp. ST_sed3]